MPFSVIEFQDRAGEILVARVPQEGTGEFITGSQLIVQDGQMAVFFRDGRLTDVFRSGRHTLSTKNLPVIGKLVKLGSFGMKSPFRAYVYFVQQKTFTNLGWGTSNPIMFRDSEFKAVHLRANGAFSLRIADPAVFLRTLVGSQGMETTYAIEEYIRRIILSRFANLLSGILETVLDLSAKYREIEVQLKQAVHDDLAQYGLELVDLLVEAITVPPEVQQMIDRAAGSRALDDSEVGKYQQMAAGDALRDASHQPGGHGMTDMVGLGAGMGIAQQMAAGMAQSGPGQTPPGQIPPGQTPPSPPAASQPVWHTSVGGQQKGPFTLDDLCGQIQRGEVNVDTYVWRKGMDNWIAGKDVPELADILNSATPPPPPG